MRRSTWWYLRVAASVICLTACVLFSALWVRSHWWLDLSLREIGSNYGICVISKQGQLRITLASGPFGIANVTEGTAKMDVFGETFTLPSTPYRIPVQWKTQPSVLRQFGWTRYPDGHKIIVPHWFLAAIFGIAAAVPWVRRFSLRTLLTAMTLIAGALGVIVWAAR